MNKKIIAYIFLFIFSIILRILLGEYVYINGITPNILLVTIVIISVIVPHGWLSFIYALFCGILNDVLYSKQIGYHIIIFIGLASVITYARSRLMKNNILFCLLFVAVATILYELFSYFLFGYFTMGVSFVMLMNRTVLPGLSGNILLTPLVYIIYNRLFVFLSDEKGIV